MRSRRVLQRQGVTYQEIDIEKTSGAEAQMRALNGGSGKVPTIVIEGAAGRVALIEPSDRELIEALHAPPKTA
jgi:mycoredoxin